MKKKFPLTYIPLLCLCFFAVVMMIVAVLIKKTDVQIHFTPPPFEADAVHGVPTVPENLGWQELDAEQFRFSVCGELVVKENCATIWLASPESNTVWIKLRVLDSDGIILGETGLIKPGEYVEYVEFTKIPPPSTSVTLKIMAYEPETYHSAGAVSLYTVVK